MIRIACLATAAGTSLESAMVMRHLAIVLSLSVLAACATPAALRGNSDATSLRDCGNHEDPCPSGGTGVASTVA